MLVSDPLFRDVIGHVIITIILFLILSDEVTFGKYERT